MSFPKLGVAFRSTAKLSYGSLQITPFHQQFSQPYERKRVIGFKPQSLVQLLLGPGSITPLPISPGKQETRLHIGGP